MQIEKGQRFTCLGRNSLLKPTKGLAEFEYTVQNSKVIKDIESVQDSQEVQFG